MVAKNGKSMMELVRLPILRPLLLKGEIIWQFERHSSLAESSEMRRPYNFDNVMR